MIHFVSLLVVNDKNEILVLKRNRFISFGNNWEFYNREIKEGYTVIQTIMEILLIRGIDSNATELLFLDKQEHENSEGKVVEDEEYWVVKLRHAPKIRFSFKYTKHDWIGEDKIWREDRNYMADVFHYILKYFKVFGRANNRRERIQSETSEYITKY